VHIIQTFVRRLPKVQRKSNQTPAKSINLVGVYRLMANITDTKAISNDGLFL